MRALVVYESMFGNTQAVAEAVGAGLATSMTADVVEVGTAPGTLPDDIALLVVGAPTHAFSLSRESTRRDAGSRTGQPLVSTGIGVRDWLTELGRAPSGVVAAAFDTKVNKPWLPGSAARTAQKLLRRSRFRIAADAENFLVADMAGPLVDGELDRARRWGERLAAAAAVAAGRR
jgi:hypothetical protein